MTTKTTLGELVATLFSEYEQAYADEELAAVATQVTVDDLLRARANKHRVARRATTRPHRKAA